MVPFRCGLIFFLFLFNSTNGDAIPLLLLKTMRSGSSWMTSQLNQYKGVYITEEIFNGGSIKGDLTLWNKAQEFLMHSFKSPSPQYGSKKAPKATGAFRILGASLNPIGGGQFVNLTEFVKLVPNLRLVVYSRTNKVKQAVSLIRGKMLNNKCGVMVLSNSGKKGKKKCNIAKSASILTSDLEAQFLRAIAQEDYQFAVTRSISPLLENGFYHFTYEELLSDPSSFSQLFEWLGYDPSVPRTEDLALGKCIGNCTKTTGDDLRHVIKNFREVERFLSKKYPCLLPHLYERNPGAVMPPLHICHEQYFAGEEDFINSRLEYYAKNKKIALRKVSVK